MNRLWLAALVALAGCSHAEPLEPLPGVDRAHGILSRDAHAVMQVTILDRSYQGHYVIAPKLRAIPDNFGGTRNLARSDLEMGGQGNGRATLADAQGAPLYCVFDVEPLTFQGEGQCQDREGRLFELQVAAPPED